MKKTESKNIKPGKELSFQMISSNFYKYNKSKIKAINEINKIIKKHQKT